MASEELEPVLEPTPRRSRRVRPVGGAATSLTTVLAAAAAAASVVSSSGSGTSITMAAAPSTPTRASRRLLFASFCAPNSSSKQQAKQEPSAITWKVVTPSPKRNSSKSPTPNSKKRTRRAARSPNDPSTESFAATWAGNLPTLQDDNIQAHTLILGTHPSIKSLEEAQYYAHPLNAFWWIAGDALGFRRASGISPSTNQPFKFTTALRFDNVLPYETQLEIFCSKGFAIWDVLKSCQRKGSLDSDIHNEVPNEVDKFCQEHPSIRRIVLANGGSSCVFFKRHFKGWLDSGQVVPGANDASQEAFKKWAVSTATATNTTNPSRKQSNPKKQKEMETATKPHRIEIISALAVSPAAARYTYEEKRDFWVKFVYAPGLRDHQKLQTQQQECGLRTIHEHTQPTVHIL